MNTDTIFEDFLLKDIEISNEKKVLYKGSLVLYKDDTYFFSIFIKKPKTDSLRKIEIPKPYNLRHNKDQTVTFDYKLSTLSRTSEAKLSAVNKIPRDRDSKYYNTVVTIKSA